VYKAKVRNHDALLSPSIVKLNAKEKNPYLNLKMMEHTNCNYLGYKFLLWQKSMFEE
jgi:hypothetical protein